MKRRTITTILSLFLVIFAFGQNKYSISGTLTDAETGEFLIGATVYITSTNTGTTTNAYGFYSISIEEKDSLGIVYSFLGYEAQIKKAYFHQDIQLDIQLEASTAALKEIVVTSESDKNVNSTEISVIDIPTTLVKDLPAILGEKDVMKVIQLLPGIQSGNEGTTGFFVRGGNADQNLVQLDGATIYNPNHLVGLMSAFNTRALNNVSIIKGGFPAEYGGRLSSVLDIRMKDGNNKKLGVEGGVGLVTSQLTIEGPLKKEVGSFIVSARRTYFDWMIGPFLPKTIKTNYHFYDTNAKLNYKLGKNDQLFLSFFLSKDKARYEQSAIEYKMELGNQATTLRWNHVFGSRLFMNTSLITSRYNQEVSALLDNSVSQVVSGIDDIQGKLDFQYFPSTAHTLKFGANYIDHTFRSSGESKVFSTANPDTNLLTDSIPEKNVAEYAFYISDDIKISKNIACNIGIRFPFYTSGSTNYSGIEPRASIKVGINETTSIKAAYTMMNQYVHLIPSSTAAIPTDIWIPSSAKTRPQTSQQYVLGLFKNFKNNLWETSIEIYYKTMDNQVLFREGNQLIRSLDVDEFLVYGKGWSYGAEFLVKKKTGQWSGWAAYTLSWSNQQFPDLNYGETFPFRFDRRHDLSLVGTYELNDKWRFSGTFVFSSGSAFTVPEGRISVANGGTLFEGNYYLFDERNNARLRSFHRLNLAATYKKDRTLWGKTYSSEWIFSLYNVYSRQNPYFIYFDIDPNTEKPRAKQVSLLPIIPSVSFNFKF